MTAATLKRMSFKYGYSWKEETVNRVSVKTVLTRPPYKESSNGCWSEFTTVSLNLPMKK